MRIIYRFFGDVTSTVNHAHSLHTTTYDHEEDAGEVTFHHPISHQHDDCNGSLCTLAIFGDGLEINACHMRLRSKLQRDGRHLYNKWQNILLCSRAKLSRDLCRLQWDRFTFVNEITYPNKRRHQATILK